MILSMEEEQVHFYTRITRPDELSLKECLDFAQDFHAKTLEKAVRRNWKTILKRVQKGTIQLTRLLPSILMQIM